MNNGRLRDDSRPARSLAAAVMLDAVKSLTAEGETDLLRMERDEAKLFFERADSTEYPCNLAWCCQILNLNPQAVRDRLHKVSHHAVMSAKKSMAQWRR